MRTVCTIWFVLIFCSISTAQENNTSSLLKQAEEILYTDPQQAIRIAEYVSEKSDQTSQLIQAAYILTRGFYMAGKQDQALKIGLKFSEKEIHDTPDTQIQLNILLSKILNELELKSLSKFYRNNANSLLDNDTPRTTKNWVKGKSIQYSLNLNQTDSTQYLLNQLYKVKNKLKGTGNETFPEQIGSVDLDLADIHLREFEMDSVEVYLKIAFTESRKEKPGNYLEMKALIGYSNFLFMQNAHSKAIDSLNSAMEIAKKFQNLSEQIIISRAIAENYLALNNLEQFNSYNKKADNLNSVRGDLENDAVNIAYNIFNSNINENYNSLRAKSRWYLIMLGGILLFLLLFWIFTKWRYQAKINQYRKFIDYLDKKKEVAPIPSLKKSENVRTLNVPKEAEDILLIRLAEFEDSLDFTNKDLSLSRLALQFDTNTKYLSETVNFHKEKNFNAYINELRISYIIDKLKNDPQYLQYKISYLAEDAGFSSHSVFTTVFKSVTGISPTTFIKILQEEKENPAA